MSSERLRLESSEESKYLPNFYPSSSESKSVAPTNVIKYIQNDFLQIPKIGSTADELYDESEQQMKKNYSNDIAPNDNIQMFCNFAPTSATTQPIFSSLLYNISNHFKDSINHTNNFERSKAKIGHVDNEANKFVNKSAKERKAVSETNLAQNVSNSGYESLAYCKRPTSSLSTVSSLSNSLPLLSSSPPICLSTVQIGREDTIIKTATISSNAKTASETSEIKNKKHGIVGNDSCLITQNHTNSFNYQLVPPSSKSDQLKFGNEILKPTPLSSYVYNIGEIGSASYVRNAEATLAKNDNLKTTNSAFEYVEIAMCNSLPIQKCQNDLVNLVNEPTTELKQQQHSRKDSLTSQLFTNCEAKKRKKKPYKELTLEEKVELIRLAERNSALSQASIAERYAIAKSNVCRILQRRAEYLCAYESAGFAGSRKRKLRSESCAPVAALSAAKLVNISTSQRKISEASVILKSTSATASADTTSIENLATNNREYSSNTALVTSFSTTNNSSYFKQSNYNSGGASPRTNSRHHAAVAYETIYRCCNSTFSDKQTLHSHTEHVHEQQPAKMTLKNASAQYKEDAGMLDKNEFTSAQQILPYTFGNDYQKTLTNNSQKLIHSEQTAGNCNKPTSPLKSEIYEAPKLNSMEMLKATLLAIRQQHQPLLGQQSIINFQNFSADSTPNVRLGNEMTQLLSFIPKPTPLMPPVAAINYDNQSHLGSKPSVHNNNNNNNNNNNQQLVNFFCESQPNILNIVTSMPMESNVAKSSAVHKKPPNIKENCQFTLISPASQQDESAEMHDAAMRMHGIKELTLSSHSNAPSKQIIENKENTAVDEQLEKREEAAIDAILNFSQSTVRFENDARTSYYNENKDAPVGENNSYCVLKRRDDIDTEKKTTNISTTDQNSDTASSVFSSISNSPIDLRSQNDIDINNNNNENKNKQNRNNTINANNNNNLNKNEFNNNNSYNCNQHSQSLEKFHQREDFQLIKEPNELMKDFLNKYGQLEICNINLKNELIQLRKYAEKCENEMEQLKYRNSLLECRLISCHKKLQIVSHMENTFDVTQRNSNSMIATRELVNEVLRMTSI